LKKCATHGKVLYTWKKAPHLEKCATLEKVLQTRKIASHLENCDVVFSDELVRIKMGQTCKNGPKSQKWDTFTNKITLKKEAPFEK